METFSALLAICAGNSPVPGFWVVYIFRKFVTLFRHVSWMSQLIISKLDRSKEAQCKQIRLL